MQKIERLTKEQAERLPKFRDEYLQHGINCAPADRPRAEAAFARAYKAIGKEMVPVIWVDSPITASLCFHALSNLKFTDTASSPLDDESEKLLRASLRDSLWDSLGASLRASLGDSLGDSLRASLEDSLWTSLGASLRDSLWASLRASLRDSLWDSLGASLGDSLGDSLGASLRDSLGASLGDSKIKAQLTYWWGQQDIYWIGFYKFCADLGVQYEASAADRLDIMHEISMSCMWWYPRDGVIIACERPLAVNFDERERLHNDAGPAVEFRDGWKLYRVHGVDVPEWLFTNPERMSIEAIHQEGNTEVQRVMIERFGWDRYAAECGAEIVDHDEKYGTLMRRGRGEDAILFLKVINRSPEPDGSFRKYILPVDSELRPIPDPMNANENFGESQALTAVNAVASTFGLRGKDYASLLGAES
jgi:hypothetical protein